MVALFERVTAGVRRLEARLHGLEDQMAKHSIIPGTTLSGVFPHLECYRAPIVPSNDNVTEGQWPQMSK